MAVATVSSSGPRRHLVWVEKLGATAGWLPALLSFQTIRAVSSSVGFLENTALSFGSESGYSAWLSPLHVTARLLAPTDVSPSDFSTQTFAEHLLCARYHVHIIISFHSNLRKEGVISSPVLRMRTLRLEEGDVSNVTEGGMAVKPGPSDSQVSALSHCAAGKGVGG